MLMICLVHQHCIQCCRVWGTSEGTGGATHTAEPEGVVIVCDACVLHYGCTVHKLLHCLAFSCVLKLYYSTYLNNWTKFLLVDIDSRAPVPPTRNIQSCQTQVRVGKGREVAPRASEFKGLGYIEMATTWRCSYRCLFAVTCRRWRLSSGGGRAYWCLSLSTIRDGRKRVTVDGHKHHVLTDTRSSKSGLQWSILHATSFSVRLAILWSNF